VDRFGLTQKKWLALGEYVGQRGGRRTARSIGMSPEELDLVVRGAQFPTIGDRTKIIQFLIRNQLAGRAVGERGDPYRPDGTEHTTRTETSERQSRAERRALSSWALPSGSERD
jgi:hypothetical protein